MPSENGRQRPDKLQLNPQKSLWFANSHTLIKWTMLLTLLKCVRNLVFQPIKLIELSIYQSWSSWKFFPSEETILKELLVLMKSGKLSSNFGFHTIKLKSWKDSTHASNFTLFSLATIGSDPGMKLVKWLNFQKSKTSTSLEIQFTVQLTEKDLRTGQWSARRFHNLNPLTERWSLLVSDKQPMLSIE